MNRQEYVFKKAPDHKYFSFNGFWGSVNGLGEVQLHLTEDRAEHPLRVVEEYDETGMTRRITPPEVAVEKVVHASGKISHAQLPEFIAFLQQLYSEHRKMAGSSRT